jgi:hypothetical protein
MWYHCQRLGCEVKGAAKYSWVSVLFNAREIYFVANSPLNRQILKMSPYLSKWCLQVCQTSRYQSALDSLWTQEYVGFCTIFRCQWAHAFLTKTPKSYQSHGVTKSSDTHQTRPSHEAVRPSYTTTSYNPFSDMIHRLPVRLDGLKWQLAARAETEF